MATLKDVAKKAGVSTATVSCCLSGAKPVKAETRLRILQAVEELNYIPNAAARELRRITSNKIGLVLPDLADPYYNGILRGILGRIRSGDYILNIVFSDQNPREEQKKIEELINANVAGLLIVTCQPENGEFFRTRVLKTGLPSVFVHQKPRFDADYIGIDNYSVMKALTARLLEKNYTDIALITGPQSFFSEEECLRGVRDAFLDMGLPFPAENLYDGNFTKENAFRSAMLACRERIPHAILSTSPQRTLGIKEALDVSGIRVPQDTVLAGLGVESWNETSRLEGVIYSRRSADSLGAGAADLLLRQISGDRPNKPVSITYADNRRFTELPLPVRPSAPETVLVSSPPIRVLAFESPSVEALDMLTRSYSKQHGVTFHFEVIPMDRIIPAIVTNSRMAVPDYDLCFFDTPWTPYLDFYNVLEDLTPALEQGKLGNPDFYPEFLSNARAGGRQIGLPAVCGTQVIFYRKDLFESPAVMKAYQSRCGETLHPPRYWLEYNRIAEFFTRSCNPDSPTEYGTAIPCWPNDYLIPELMPRLWSRSSRLWDSSFRPTLDAPQTEQGYQLFLDALRYAPGNPFATDAARVIDRFCSGDAAMILAFTDYAGQIRDSLDKNIIRNIGYAPVPGQIAMKAGRNLGIFKNSTRKEEIYAYLRWAFSDSTSNYFTILGGQSCVRPPYENSEIIEQYPWMELTRHPSDHFCSRGVPVRQGHSDMIPINRFEAVLCDTVRRVLCDSMPLKASLTIAQVEMEALFAEYGF